MLVGWYLLYYNNELCKYQRVFSLRYAVWFFFTRCYSKSPFAQNRSPGPSVLRVGEEPWPCTVMPVLSSCRRGWLRHELAFIAPSPYPRPSDRSFTTRTIWAVFDIMFFYIYIIMVQQGEIYCMYLCSAYNLFSYCFITQATRLWLSSSSFITTLSLSNLMDLWHPYDIAHDSA